LRGIYYLVLTASETHRQEPNQSLILAAEFIMTEIRAFYSAPHLATSATQ